MAGTSPQAASAGVLRVVSRGDGIVTTGDRRISCGAKCSARYRRRAVVAVRATPGPNFEFARWSGACVGAAPTCNVALNRSRRLQALFEPIRRTVSVTVGGPGAVVSDPPGLSCGASAPGCAGTFAQGTTVRLTAVPAADGTFASWGSACQGAPPGACEISVGSDVEALAAFGHAEPEPDDALLTVTPQGVKVTSNPPGIDCPDACGAEFSSGTLVTLTGAGPTSWSGACAGALISCTLVLDAAAGVTATAAAVAPRTAGVSVTVSGPGTVSGGGQIRCGGTTGTLSDCRALFNLGTTVVLTAKAARRGSFKRWSGFCRGKRRRCSLSATAPKTVTALFRR